MTGWMPANLNLPVVSFWIHLLTVVLQDVAPGNSHRFMYILQYIFPSYAPTGVLVLNPIAVLLDGACVSHGIVAMPDNLQWGTGGDHDTLCSGVTPCKIWIVGVLWTMSFTRAMDIPSDCTVSLYLLRDVDHDALRKMTTWGSWHLPTGRTVTVKHTSTNTDVFTRMYNATSTFTAEHLMHQISPQQFLMGDIVLVEARVLCTECGDDVTCSFDMLSISRLFATEYRSPGVVHGDFIGSM
ncbi:hypothetical protein C8Q74DRAFT_1222695 [Fomes fomentarius]|nr:hypothetical protein C8Q74DRAFT_1222683 [Fomes fomentarius]KAI0749060.1 hypothetical protein C8Q74DRAFT_1222695 [Fomes fomentarius]